MGSLTCGKCLQPFKSILKMKYHMANEHGVKNEFSLGMTTSEYSKLWKAQREPLEDLIKDGGR